MLRLALRSALFAVVALLLAPGGAHAQVDASAGGLRVAAGSWWGGTYTAAGGEHVRVFLSDTYPQDDATAQRWADTLGRLVHGQELSRLTAYFAPLDEVRRLCGPSAAGCYSPADQSLLAPGDSTEGISAESVLAHEYGHHVANNRANPPWMGLDWGPKRWASYTRICSRARAGTAFPGRSDRYRLQPGEAFAEAYRVLNETRAGLPLTWSVVDGSFLPDARALELVYEDVVHPWAPATTRLTGSFTTGAARVYERLLATPYDGRLTLRLAGPGGYRLRVVDAFSGRVLAAGRHVQRTVCGERSLLVRVVANGRPGRFSVSITR